MNRISSLLFSPAIALMNRLSFYKKFALLGLIALVAVSVTLYSLYMSLNKVVTSAEKERQGLALIHPLAEAIQRVQRHRGLSSGILGGASDLQPLRQTKEHEVVAAFANLENRLPAEVRQHGFWRRITVAWKDIQANGLRWERMANFSAHTRLIDEMLLFVAIIADDYGLTADPDIDAFYLAYISSNDLLKTLEQLGQMRAYGTGVLAAKQASEQQKADMKALITLLDYTLKQLKVNMEKAARYNPAIRQELSATYQNIETSSLQVMDKVHSDILSGRFSIRSAAFFAATTAAIDQGYEQLYQSLLPATDKLIRGRIQQAKSVMLTTVGIAFMLTLLVIYCMVAVYFAILGSIKALSQAVAGFVRGDMQGRVHLEAHDEFTQIGDSFNEMADELTEQIGMNKLVEEKLRLLSTAIEQNPASVVITNLNAEIEYVNTRFTEVTGYTLDEVVGQNPRILHSGLTDASVHQSLWNMLTSGQRWVGEFVNKRKDGTFYREEAYISPVKDTTGAVTHYVAVKLDITRRYQTEQRERIHNQVLEQLTRGESLEKVLVSIVRGFEQESAETFCCIMLLDDTGKRLHIGATPPHLPDFLIEAIDDIAVEDGASPCGTAAFRGERVIVENMPQDPCYASLNDLAERVGIHSCWSQPIKTSKGDVLGTFAICHRQTVQPTENDIALIELYANLAQLAIESSRAQHELRIAAIAFESKEGMMVTDSHNVILRVNKAFTSITGYSAEEAIGKAPKILSSGRQHADFYAAMWDSIAHKGAWEGEIWNRNKNGEIYPEWLSITAVKNEVGEVTHYVASMNDISEHKKVEAATLYAKEQAEALAQYKSEFLANMSHEIRTPMNAIIGLSQLALNKQVPDDVRDYLRKINSSSESLLGILNDILDFSKMEVGKLGIENTSFDLNTLLDNLRNLFAAHAQEKFLEFSIEMAQDVPAQLLGDALRIQQILSNLLGNAIKFTASGAVSLQVQLLELENSQARIHFSVKDSGIGISQKDQVRLFQPFSQADASITRRFGGTGLGLAISHKLLQLMGSEFQVESTPGKGTTFSFDLLLGIAAHELYAGGNQRNAERKAGTLTNDLRERGHRLNGCRILVVEDNSINQQVVKEFLQLCEVHVTIANNGIEALQLLENNRYDAVLMDVHMPEMGGVEATQRIRQQAEFAALPVIALTAGVTQEERDNCLGCGMDDFVKKPINPEQLVETLVYWINPSTAVVPALPTLESNEAASIDLPGFDLRNLLKMLGNNRERADQLLVGFGEEMKTLADEIGALIAAGNFTSARERVHKLKGASGNIGAVSLHSASAALEAELESGRSDAGNFSVFQAEFNQAISAIAGLSRSVATVNVEPSPSVSHRGEGDGKELKHAAVELDLLLKEGDYVSETVLNALKIHLPSDKQDLYSRLHKHVSAIQYAEARMLLRQIVELSDI